MPAELIALYERMRRSMPTSPVLDRYDGDFVHPVFGDGDYKSSLLLLGEAPGAEEAAGGRPFVGKAGRQLDDLLSDAGLQRDRLYITNVVKYRPIVCSNHSVRNRTPSREEIIKALPPLYEEMNLLEARVIATLGNTPLKAILLLAGEPSVTIGQCHGRARELKIHGCCYTLFPLYHPASGIYNRSLIETMREDARRLGEHLVKTV